MKSRPLTGAILGVLTGLGAAVFMARQGIWPPDQLTVFFLPGILGTIGLLALSIRRPSRGPGTLVIALLILVPMLVWGAFGFATINDHGVLNGGCEVTAMSADDSTVVTDTSRNDPFRIDPNGPLTWTATAPTVFQDYEWKISVVVGGIPITVDSGTEPNTAGDQENGGDVEDVDVYAESHGIDLALFRGVYEVSGSAATCDGAGFVEIEGEGIDPIALIALIAAITFLVVLIVLSFIGGEAGPTLGEDGVPDETAGDPDANHPDTLQDGDDT